MSRVDLNRIKVLLLDLDGTLINSEKAFCKAFIDVLNNYYKITVSTEKYVKYELEQNTMLIKQKKIEFPKLRNISDKEIMERIYKDYFIYFKEVIKEQEALDNFYIIKKLKEYKMKIALVSTCRRFFIDELLKTNKLDGIFNYIVSRDDILIDELKPNPKAYNMAIEYLKVCKEDCLAIEDSKRGIESALAADISTIKVENFTTVKYVDNRVDEYYSANEVLKKILFIKKNEY